jgi:XRE family aerobic/anaerobic benzoate catabolism transcriptional regulator
MAQGDFRPMAGNNEAMEDLKRILASREAFYSKADFTCSTSHKSLAQCADDLRNHIRQVAGLPL